MKNAGAALWDSFEKITRFVIGGIFKIFGREISDERFESFMQFVKFGLVGLSNTVISYVIYAVLVYFGVHYLLSSVISFVVSVLNSFFWNNKFVFTVEAGEKRTPWHALAKTFVAYSFTGLFLNNILLLLWIDVLHMSEYIAPIINMLISIPVNYLLNKFWAFKKVE